MKITDKVIALDCTKGAYAYAVLDGEVTLIDTGMPGRGKAILAELGTYGVDPKAVKRILLTHPDIDHIGNCAYLQKMTGCECYISETDYPYLTGAKRAGGMKGIFSRLMRAHLPASVKVPDARCVGPFTVIPSPGHTPGHTCYRFGDVLFAGDLFRTKDGAVTMSPKIMNWDMTVLCSTLKAFSADGYAYLCPAHGEAIPAQNRYEAFKAALPD